MLMSLVLQIILILFYQWAWERGYAADLKKCYCHDKIILLF